MYSNLEQKYRRLRKELIVGAIALLGVALIGTLWYRFVEGWSWSDALYMTVITLATVGYGETNPLGDRGRLFTISLILMGVISIGYIVNRFTEAVIQGYFQEGIRLRQRRRLIDRLTNHHILCGFGRTGRQIALEFKAEGIPFVMVDSKIEQIEAAQALGCIALQGDATLDDTLLRAGIERAVCLVAALPSDA
ncbi:MAG TPA: potassium channel family protein, partial [Coleofasciculaceae cyanobacterium]